MIHSELTVPLQVDAPRVVVVVREKEGEIASCVVLWRKSVLLRHKNDVTVFYEFLRIDTGI